MPPPDRKDVSCHRTNCLCKHQPVRVRKRIRVVIGAPIQPAGHDAESLTAAAFQRITELMPAYKDQPGRKLLRRQLTNLF